jgi:hypothetical protein
MLSVRSLVTTGVAAIMVAATTGTAAATAPTTTHSPAQGAAGWLAQQFTDHYNYPGGTYFDGGSTADSIFALAAAGVGKTKIKAAITYFAQHVTDYTSINDKSGKPGPYDGSVAKTAVAALVAGASPTKFGGYNLLQALKDDQCTTVSKPASDTDYTTPTCPAVGAARNIFSSISESLAILAEARGAKSFGSTYAPNSDAVTYILSLQCGNGGFTADTSGGKGCTSDPDATGYALMALEALGNQPTATDKAAHWLTRTRNADGSWTAQQVHNVDSTGLAAAALSAHGVDTTRSVQWLVSQQVTDGPTLGKGATRGALKYHGSFDASSSIKATADGLLGMVAQGSLAALSAAGATPGIPVFALAAPTLSKHTIRAGHDETVTGTGFSAGERVHAVLSSAARSAGTAKADKAGTVRLTFTVPSSFTGGHQVTLTGQRSRLSSTASFSVAAVAAPTTPTTAAPTAAPTQSGPVLADTGRDSRQTGAEIGIALALIVGGGAVLVLARRKPRRR